MTNGYAAYTNNQSKTEDARVTEARALLRCAMAMEEAKRPETSYFDYCDAVRKNQRLWTIFQASLIDNTALPMDLRNTLKGLSVYVDRRSLRAYGEQNPMLLDILITINKQIAAGLVPQSEEGEAQQAAAPKAEVKAEAPPVATSGLGMGSNI